MKKCLLIIFTLLLVSNFLHAEEGDRQYPPEGMEIIKIGHTEILVPKGTRLRKKGDMNVVEDISEYASRKFVEIEKRFDRLEAKQQAIEETLAQIKEDLLKTGRHTDR